MVFQCKMLQQCHWIAKFHAFHAENKEPKLTVKESLDRGLSCGA